VLGSTQTGARGAPILALTPRAAKAAPLHLYACKYVMCRAAKVENRTHFDSVGRRAARAASGVSATVHFYVFDLERGARRARWSAPLDSGSKLPLLCISSLSHCFFSHSGCIPLWRGAEGPFSRFHLLHSALSSVMLNYNMTVCINICYLFLIID